MPVHTRHPEYEAWAPRWSRIRDAVSGRYVVSRKGETYLPRLGGQTDDDYLAYKNRARWYAAPSRVISALVGTALVKPPMITIEKELEHLLVDCDGTGTSLNTFIARVLTEIVTVGRSIIRLDMAADRKPVLGMYNAESMINWKSDGVVLQTKDPAESEDWFQHLNETVYRVLRVVDGKLEFTMYNEKGEMMNMPTVPVRKGNPVTFLPVVVPSSVDLSFDIDPSPIEPIVDLAFNYWQLSADYFHGLHFVGLPTPWITGFGAGDEVPTAIGPTALWALPMGFQVGLLEYGGTGLNEIANAMETCKREMADMGARILESRSKTAEAEATVALKMSSDASSLSSVVSRTSEALTRILRMAHDWSGLTSENARVEMSTEFLPHKLQGDELRGIIDAWLKGALTKEDLYINLTQGGVVHEEDFDVWVQSVEESEAQRAGALQPGGLPGVAPKPGKKGTGPSATQGL